MTPPAPSVPSDSAPNPQGSTLGGKEAIMQRFQAAMRGEDTKVTPEAKVEKVEAPEKVEKVETSQAPEKKESSILPQEKELPKPVAKVEAPKKVELPKGSDGLNKEERAELLKFKAEAERAKELEVKLKDYEITTKELTELRALKGELENKAKTYEAKATAFDITATPKFQQTIAQPMAQLVQAMQTLCAGNALSEDEVFLAIENADTTKGNAVLSEFMSSLNTLDQRSFDRIIGDMRDLNRKGQELVAKAPEAWTALQAEQQKEQAAQKVKDKETYSLANDAVFKAMQDRFPFMKEEAVAKEIKEGALSVDFDTMSPDAKAYYIQAGLAALHFNPLVKAKDEEIASLKAALKKHQITVGPLNGSRPAEKTEEQANEETMKGMSSGERMVAAMASLQGR